MTWNHTKFYKNKHMHGQKNGEEAMHIAGDNVRLMADVRPEPGGGSAGFYVRDVNTESSVAYAMY
jgi:S-formylglutathione hydrolase FrmB